MIETIISDAISLLRHSVLISVIFALALSQLIKAFVQFIRKEKITRHIFWQNGAMPSTHTASMVALTVALYFENGINSLTIVGLVLTVLVARDALGVRFHAGTHARAINILNQKKKKYTPLDEQLGHTLFEVIIGAAVGFIAAVAVRMMTSGLTCGL